MPSLDLAAAVGGAGLQLAILLAAGFRLRTWARLPVAPGARLAVDLAIGSWLAATLLLLVAVAGRTSLPALLGVVVVVAALGRWRRSGRCLRPLVAAAVGGLLTLPLAVAPPVFYDALVYHLGLPWQAVLEGRLAAHPENLFAAFPPLAQLLALPALAAGLDRVPGLLHWASWLVAAAGVHGLARSVGAPRPAASAAALATTVLPATAGVPGFAAAEGWFLVAVVAAVAVGRRPRPGSALLAGLLAGVATATRLQGLPWALVVLVVVVAAGRHRRVRSAVAVAGGWVVGAVPWWVKNLVLLGDPTAPLGWQREGLDTLWRDSASLLQQGYSLAACLEQLPTRALPEAAYLVPLLLAAALALVTARRSRWLGAAALAGLPIWIITGALPRFLSVTLVLLVACAAATRGSSMARTAAVAVVLWCAALGAGRTAGLLGALKPGRFLPMTSWEAAAAASPSFPGALFNACDALPADARVLLVAEPRGFLFPRSFVTTSQHDVSPLRGFVEGSTTAAEVAARLGAAGYTHLLVNWRELRRLGAAYPVAPWRSAAGRERFVELISDLGPAVLASDGAAVYRVGR